MGDSEESSVLGLEFPTQKSRQAGRQVERLKKTESTVLLDRQKQLVAQEAR